VLDSPVRLWNSLFRNLPILFAILPTVNGIAFFGAVRHTSKQPSTLVLESVSVIWNTLDYPLEETRKAVVSIEHTTKYLLSNLELFIIVRACRSSRERVIVGYRSQKAGMIGRVDMYNEILSVLQQVRFVVRHVGSSKDQKP
jgi:hypothetical protein